MAVAMHAALTGNGLDSVPFPGKLTWQSSRPLGQAQGGQTCRVRSSCENQHRMLHGRLMAVAMHAALTGNGLDSVLSRETNLAIIPPAGDRPKGDKIARHGVHARTRT